MDEDFAERQAIQQCALLAGGDVEDEADLFLEMLRDTHSGESVLLQLNQLGFQKKWLPPGQLHRHFPRASQVTRYASTAAYCYTIGTIFAYEMNRLLREHKLRELFRDYGACVRALYEYTEEMQEHYGCKQTLYRGIVASWYDVRDEYRVGKAFRWPSFTSTSNDKSVAVEFAMGLSNRGSGGPVLFEIETATRGAPILRWSKYPKEGEVLLQPYQGFQVTKHTVESGMLIVRLRTIKVGQGASLRGMGVRAPPHQISGDEEDRVVQQEDWIGKRLEDAPAFAVCLLFLSWFFTTLRWEQF